MIWLKFAAIQLIQLLATVVGWVLLLPFCWAHAWKLNSFSDWKVGNKIVDRWSWEPLNYIYGNPEDGVCGMFALVWSTLGYQQPYMPSAGVPAWWRAYCWSAWRNSCDNLKYVFADPKGPLVTFKLFGRTVKMGWQMENGYNVPVLSI